MSADDKDSASSTPAVTVYSSLGSAANVWRQYLRPYLLNSDIDDDHKITSYEELAQYRNKQLTIGFPVRTTFGVLLGAAVGAILFRGRMAGKLSWFGAGIGSGVTWVRVQDAYRTHDFSSGTPRGPSSAGPASIVADDELRDDDVEVLEV